MASEVNYEARYDEITQGFAIFGLIVISGVVSDLPQLYMKNSRLLFEHSDPVYCFR